MRRFRRAFVVGVLVVAVVVVGALAVAERWGRPLAERTVSDAIRERYDLAVSPRVRLLGRPFLWHVANGELDGARAELAALDAEGLELTDVVVDLERLRFSPLGLLGDDRRVRSDRAVARATVSGDELSRYLADRGLAVQITLSAGTVGLAGRLDVAGFPVDASGSAELELVDGRFELRPLDVRIEQAGLPSDIEDRVLRLLRFSVALPELFEGVAPTSLRITAAGVTLEADVTEPFNAAAER